MSDRQRKTICSKKLEQMEIFWGISISVENLFFFVSPTVLLTCRTQYKDTVLNSKTYTEMNITKFYIGFCSLLIFYTGKAALPGCPTGSYRGYKGICRKLFKISSPFIGQPMWKRRPQNRRPSPTIIKTFYQYWISAYE